MLSGICPGCGLRADLDVFCAQADTNRALAAALDLPPSLSGRVLRYLRLFSPPNKALALGKVTRLLVELADAVGSAQVSRRGVAYVAPLDLWGAALDAVLAQPPETLPLTGHGYLFQVAWNLADRAATRRERALEDRARHGQRPGAGLPPTPAFPHEGGGSESADSAPADEAALSSRPAGPRAPPSADFRALIGKLTGSIVSQSPAVSTPNEE